jgi:maltose-binding protein MalE
MSAHAADKDAAFAVMDFLTSDASAVTRAKLARVVVANPRAFDDPDVASDKVVAAFRAQLQHVVWMPKPPAMRSVWTPYRTALGEALAGRADPAARLLEVEKEVRGYVDR